MLSSARLIGAPPVEASPGWALLVEASPAYSPLPARAGSALGAGGLGAADLVPSFGLAPGGLGDGSGLSASAGLDDS
jgi:hypothetical protein